MVEFKNLMNYLNYISKSLFSAENFKKRPETEINSLNVPYDYGSIMHYGLKDFSENELPTLRVSPAY